MLTEFLRALAPALALAMLLYFGMWISLIARHLPVGFESILLWESILLFILASFVIRTRPPKAEPNQDNLLWALLTFALIMVLGALHRHVSIGANLRLITWLSSPVVYFACRQWGQRISRLAVLGTLPVLVYESIGCENDNILSMTLIAYSLLAWNELNWGALISVLAVSAYGLYYRHTQAILIALPFAGAALCFHKYRRLSMVAALIAVILIVVLRNHTSHFFQGRDIFLRIALADWAQYPIFGKGPTAIFFDGMDLHAHAHNLILTTLSELGLVGLVVITWIGFAIGRHWKAYSARDRFYILVFAMWSLVDDPLQWPLINGLFMLVLSLHNGSVNKAGQQSDILEGLKKRLLKLRLSGRPSLS